MTITETTNEQQSSEQEVPQTAVLLQLDPSVLVGHPSNPRTKLTGIKELAQSVKLVGIVQPLVVTQDDAGYRIIAGHRRAAAALPLRSHHLRKATAPHTASTMPNGQVPASQP